MTRHLPIAFFSAYLASQCGFSRSLLLHKSDLISLVFFGQWNIASLGTGPPQQKDQAHRVSDRQAQEDCEMLRGMKPYANHLQAET